jgi:uncharacterized membrane protein
VDGVLVGAVEVEVGVPERALAQVRSAAGQAVAVVAVVVAAVESNCLATEIEFGEERGLEGQWEGDVVP